MASISRRCCAASFATCRSVSLSSAFSLRNSIPTQPLWPAVGARRRPRSSASSPPSRPRPPDARPSCRPWRRERAGLSAVEPASLPLDSSPLEEPVQLPDQGLSLLSAPEPSLKASPRSFLKLRFALEPSLRSFLKSSLRPASPAAAAFAARRPVASLLTPGSPLAPPSRPLSPSRRPSLSPPRPAAAPCRARAASTARRPTVLSNLSSRSSHDKVLKTSQPPTQPPPPQIAGKPHAHPAPALAALPAVSQPAGANPPRDFKSTAAPGAPPHAFPPDAPPRRAATASIFGVSSGRRGSLVGQRGGASRWGPGACAHPGEGGWRCGRGGCGADAGRWAGSTASWRGLGGCTACSCGGGSCSRCVAWSAVESPSSVRSCGRREAKRER